MLSRYSSFNNKPSMSIQHDPFSFIKIHCLDLVKLEKKEIPLIVILKSDLIMALFSSLLYYIQKPSCKR